jgi:hypothetical protein
MKKRFTVYVWDKNYKEYNNPMDIETEEELEEYVTAVKEFNKHEVQIIDHADNDNVTYMG